jgi:hypothetical protein
MATCNGTAAVTRARAAVASHVAASHVAIVACCNRRMVQRRMVQRRMVPASARFDALGVAFRLTPGRRAALQRRSTRTCAASSTRTRPSPERPQVHSAHSALNATRCNTVHRNATQCITLQHDDSRNVLHAVHAVQRRARYCDHTWRRPSRSASRRNVCATTDVASRETALHRHRNGSIRAVQWGSL